MVFTMFLGFSTPLTAQAASIDQIAIQAVPTQDGLVAVFLTNNSSTILEEVDLYIYYYDASGATIDMDADYAFDVLPGATVVYPMFTPESGYASYELDYELVIEDYDYYTSYSGVTASAAPGNGSIIVSCTNNTGTYLDWIDYIVLFYKGSTLVSMSWESYMDDIAAGDTAYAEELAYNQSTYEDLVYGVDYDNVVVYVNGAYTYNY